MRPLVAVAVPVLVLAGVASAINLSNGSSDSGSQVLAANGQAAGTGLVVDSPPVAPARPSPSVPVEAGPASVTIVNEYPGAVRLAVNGTTYDLAPGQQVAGASVVPAPSGNDIVELAPAAMPACGTGDADRLFSAGRTYRLTVVASRGNCGENVPGTAYSVSPA